MTGNQNINSQNLFMDILGVDAPVGFKIIRKYVPKMVIDDFRLEKIGNLWEIKTKSNRRGNGISN